MGRNSRWIAIPNTQLGNARWNVEVAGITSLGTMVCGVPGAEIIVPHVGTEIRIIAAITFRVLRQENRQVRQRIVALCLHENVHDRSPSIGVIGGGEPGTNVFIASQIHIEAEVQIVGVFAEHGEAVQNSIGGFQGH